MEYGCETMEKSLALLVTIDTDSSVFARIAIHVRALNSRVLAL